MRDPRYMKHHVILREIRLPPLIVNGIDSVYLIFTRFPKQLLLHGCADKAVSPGNQNMLHFKLFYNRCIFSAYAAVFLTGVQ